MGEVVSTAHDGIYHGLYLRFMCIEFGYISTRFRVLPPSIITLGVQSSLEPTTKHDTKRSKYKRLFNVDNRERGSHARGRSRHKNNSKRVVRNLKERNVGARGKVPNKA